MGQAIAGGFAVAQFAAGFDESRATILTESTTRTDRVMLLAERAIEARLDRGFDVDEISPARIVRDVTKAVGRRLTPIEVDAVDAVWYAAAT